MVGTLTDIQPPKALLSIAIVDGDPAQRAQLERRLGGLAQADWIAGVDALASVEGLNGRARPGLPTVVVLGPSEATTAGLAHARTLIRSHASVAVVLVTDEPSTELLRQAMRSGIRDVVEVADRKQLLNAIELAAEELIAEAAAAPPAAAAPSGPLGRVTTVFSTKGGSGKSVIAANLAVLLAKRSDRPVVVVDADLQFGDMAVMLALSPQRSIVDAVSSMDRLDEQLLRSLLVRDDRSGVYVLPAPTEPAFADQVSAGDMTKVIRLLRTFCAHVIVDTSAHFTEVLIGILEESDNIIVVAGMDVPNIKNVKIGLQTLRLLNIPSSKVKLVLNRANAKVGLKVNDIERTLGIKTDLLLASDVEIPRSVNKGIPVVVDAPRSPIARSFFQLADLIAVPAE